MWEERFERITKDRRIVSGIYVEGDIPRVGLRALVCARWVWKLDDAQANIVTVTA